MYEHILEFHPKYNQHEADVYAVKWADDAYDKEDQREMDATRAAGKKTIPWGTPR